MSWEEWVAEVAKITGDDPKDIICLPGFVWQYKDRNSPKQGSKWVKQNKSIDIEKANKK